MPWAAPRPCNHPGCPNLIRGKERFCPKHQREYDNEYNRQRGSSASRGYDARWQRYRKWFLKNHPYCVNYGECGNMASTVDHIILPKGKHDPLFWDTNNHQAMCKSCHSRKTAKQDGRWGKNRSG